ncbi:unnamed protein product, partial [Ixodes persulcatus]
MKDEKPEVQLNGLAKEEERAAVAPVNGDQPGSIQTTAASLDIGGKPEAGTKVPGGPPVGGVLQRPGPSACPSVLASPPMFGAAPVNGQGAKGLRGGPPPLALTPQGLTPQGMNPQGMASQGLAGPAPAQYRTAAFLSRYSTTLPPQASGPYHAGYGQPQTVSSLHWALSSASYFKGSFYFGIFGERTTRELFYCRLARGNGHCNGSLGVPAPCTISRVKLATPRECRAPHFLSPAHLQELHGPCTLLLHRAQRRRK